MDIKQEYDSSESAEDADIDDNEDEESLKDGFTGVFIKQEPCSSPDDNITMSIKEEIDIKEEPASDPDSDDYLKADIYKKHYTCHVCEFTTKRKAGFNAHMKVHAVGKRFKCAECPYSCAKRRELTKHLRTHTGDKPPKWRRREEFFNCDSCFCKFASRRSLMQHLKASTRGKFLACDLCKYKATSRCVLNVHMRKAHQSDMSEVQVKDMSVESDGKAAADDKVLLIGLVIPKSPVKNNLDNLPDDTAYHTGYLLFGIPSPTAL